MSRPNPALYDLQTRIKPSDMELTVDPGMRWGEMPREDLMAKFEETYTGEQPHDLVNDFVRGEIMDRRYDKPLFEDEAPRGRTNQQAGYLQLIHYGHRGNEEVERPEQFLGFGGYEDIDPRGVAADPNMELMKNQAAARMRLVNFKPDACENVTGLGRSESQVIADNLKVRQWWRRNLKIFDRQLDGRQSGLRRTYEHRPAVEKVETDKTYGDRIKDWALTPQRKATVMKPGINPLDYQGETFDQDLAYARYGQACRKATRVTKHNHADAEADSTIVAPEDKVPTFKIIAQSVEVHAAARRELQDAQSVTNGISTTKAAESLAYKRQAEANISTVLHETQLNTVLRDTDLSTAIKNPNMVQREHMARQIDADGVTPSHHFLNAEVIRKAAALGDFSVVSKHVAQDNIEVADQTTARVVKASKLQSGNQREHVVRDADVVSDTHFATKSYRHRGIQRARAGTGADTQHIVTAENNTMIRRGQHANPTPGYQAEQNVKFGDNAHAERHAGGVGGKYTWHLADRDGRNTVDVKSA